MSEFMVKTQDGDLIQVKHFIRSDINDKYYIDSDNENSYLANYKTKERRDKVFEQLETWIGWMIFFNAFGSNEVIMKEQGYDTAPFMIFEFPKE